MSDAPDNMSGSTTSNRSVLRRALLFALLLFATWLVWSGLFKPILITLGFLSCALTVYIARRMGFFDTTYGLKVSLRPIGYLAWLCKEVLFSSLEVARVVLTPRLPISPTVIAIDALSAHTADQVILANSITLTPGTLALDVHDGRILVHALTKAGAAELTAGEMNARVARLRLG
jgi:multicomponent Na+:H+ antiporter subunit E